MSTLLMDELYNGVTFTQNFKIFRDISVAHIRPWIYKQGTIADGDLQCQVLDGATVLASATINYADINAALTSSYAHGFIRFDFDALTLRIPEGSTEKEYTLKFSMINHSTNTTNFIAICRRWDAKVYSLYAGVPGDVPSGDQAKNDAIEPAGFEIFEHRSV